VGDISSNPLDSLLRQVAEKALSARVRTWARRLLEHGEPATSPALATNCRSGSLPETPTAGPGGTSR
jgi:hypothetical protein